MILKYYQAFSDIQLPLLNNEWIVVFDIRSIMETQRLPFEIDWLKCCLTNVFICPILFKRYNENYVREDWPYVGRFCQLGVSIWHE
jgi:hypothetical protein